MTRIKRLFLRNFRCHECSLIDFSDGINLITGPNAAGKTSILEAIHLFLAGRSFRSTNLSELISWDEAVFNCEILFIKNGVEQRLSLMYNGSERQIKHNQTPLSSLASLLGILPGITLTPYDIELIIGPPKVRRQFLDLYLTQLDPLYFHHLSRFYGAMKRRNILLKRRAKRELLMPFEELMGRASKGINAARKNLLESLYCTDNLETLTLEYICSPFDLTQLKKEMDLGYTLTGPHKDDFMISLNQKPAKAFASEGQKRYVAMALKIALYHHYHKECKETPILCIDDVGMGFDTKRVIRLANQLKDLGQVLLSSCRPLEGLQPALVVPIEAGKLQEELLQVP